MNTPRLVLPSPEYKISFLAAVDEFIKEGHESVCGFVLTPTYFDELMVRFVDQREGRNLAEGYVPETHYWLVGGSEYLASVSVRHRLTPTLENWGGHIGYEVRPTQRRKGYGTLALRLVLPHANRLGIDPALLTCDESNVASRRIIESCGGVLAGRAAQEGKPAKLKFWVPTAPRA